MYCRYGKCSKILNTFLFLLANEMLVVRARFLKKPDLGLHCLSRHFWQATNGQILEHSSYSKRTISLKVLSAKTYGLAHEILKFIVFVISKGAEEHAHVCSLQELGCLGGS